MKIVGKPLHQLELQLNSLYGVCEEDRIKINQAYDECLFKMAECFSKIKNKYYFDIGSGVKFSTFHSGQWLFFLYTMANIIGRGGENETSDKIYCLSKVISSADIYYGVNMPDIWFFDHPQGCVMGRAEYSNYFAFLQGCTVGGNNGSYPRLGKYVCMMSNSKILGDSHIGDYTIISANTYIVDTDIPACSLVFGTSPNLIIKPISKQRCIDIIKNGVVDFCE